MLICENCGEECEVVTIDEGVGESYMGSSWTFHHDYIKVSDCCLDNFQEAQGDE